MRNIFLHAFGISVTLVMAIMLIFTQDLTNIKNQLSLAFVLVVFSVVTFVAIKENRR